MSIYAFPNAGGVKFKGAFLVPDLTGDGVILSSATIVKWLTGDVSDRWTTWYKPQIDAMHTQGANCVELLFSAQMRIAGYVTAPQLAAGIAQMANYCASLGMWFIPSCVDAPEWPAYSLTTVAVQSYLTEIAGEFTKYNNIPGFTVVDEIDLQPAVYALTATWLAAARNGMARSVPVTCSFSSDATPTDGATMAAFGANYVAFNHFNTAQAVSDLESWVFNAGSGASGTTDYPVIVTSTGYNTDAGAGSAAYYTDMKAWLNHNRLQMLGIWSAVDYYTDNKFGMYTSAQNGSSVFTTPRTAKTDVYATFPATIGAYDATEDVGALVEAAPSVVMSGTQATVSWLAAAGSGTKTYTAQYARLDANGFPETTWQDGTPTTGLSSVFVAMPPHRSYAFRVRTDN